MADFATLHVEFVETF